MVVLLLLALVSFSTPNWRIRSTATCGGPIVTCTVWWWWLCGGGGCVWWWLVVVVMVGGCGGGDCTYGGSSCIYIRWWR